jgi:hypothetical protein
MTRIKGASRIRDLRPRWRPWSKCDRTDVGVVAAGSVSIG